MINTIIFDFGDVFINLDKQGSLNALKKLGLSTWDNNLILANEQFEKGLISENNFLETLKKQVINANSEDVKEAWNAVLLDFPLYRLEFLELLAKNYRLFLLSNTDSIHIDKFESSVGSVFARDFYKCFEKVYFSFEMKMRKPDQEIFNHLINRHELSVKRTLFVDDTTQNTLVAKNLGMQVWNLQVGQEDVVDLFEKKIIHS